MARKTRAQLAEEREARQAIFELETRSMYPTKLMNILERATALGHELTVKDSLFYVTDFGFKDVYVLPLEYTLEGQNSLEQLTCSVEGQEMARLEEERRSSLREAALNKLTKEERELLGV